MELQLNGKILIITNRSDYTADVVIKRLRERNVAFVRFNTEDYPLRTKASVRVQEGKDKVTLKCEKWELDDNGVASVWYRRPALPNLESANLDPKDKEFAARESVEFMQTLWRLLARHFWITQPDVLRRVETKALQLKGAAEVGFETPDTLFSNDIEDIKSFYRLHKCKVVVKPISHGGYGDSDEMAIFTNELGNGFDESQFDSSQSSPFIIQERVEKRLDVRLTAFGGCCFAHSISPRVAGSYAMDWRKSRPEDLRYSIIETPRKIAEAVALFMDRFQMSFGAFDFACRNDGTWVFLEANPNGQWAWLELATGAPMSDALINLLVSRGNGSL